MLILTSCGNDWNSRYFYSHPVTMTGTLNTFADSSGMLKHARVQRGVGFGPPSGK